MVRLGQFTIIKKPINLLNIFNFRIANISIILSPKRRHRNGPAWAQTCMKRLIKT